jgi:hypothetical protein
VSAADSRSHLATARKADDQDDDMVVTDPGPTNSRDAEPRSECCVSRTALAMATVLHSRIIELGQLQRPRAGCAHQ